MRRSAGAFTIAGMHICDRCGRTKIQPGRYADYICECCDVSARCPHVGFVTRLLRRAAGRRT